MRHKYRIGLRKEKEGYLALAMALPGCVSYGKTKSAALENIEDAIDAYLKSLKRHRESIPEEDDPPHTITLPAHVVTQREKMSLREEGFEGKLPRELSGREVIKALSRLGFYAERHASGSHVTMYKVDEESGRVTARTTVPLHETIKPGLLRAIIEQAHIRVKDFVEAF